MKELKNQYYEAFLKMGDIFSFVERQYRLEVDDKELKDQLPTAEQIAKLLGKI